MRARELRAALRRWRGPRGMTLVDALFALACVVAVAVLLYMARYTTFYHDEWSFIVDRREWTLDAFLRPHNEHWALVPVLVYKTLFATVGLRSYLPYLLVLMVLHVAAASSVYVLMRRLNGGLPALAAGTLLLVLGTGEDNLYWAFQIGFVGAAAAGAWAIVLLVTSASRRAEIAAAALLTVAVATSGPALFFVVAVAVMLAVDRAGWRRLWVVVPATLAYGIWYVTIGSAAISAHRDPFTVAGLQQVPSYVVTGASYAIGRLTGWGDQVGLVVFVVLGLATALHVSGPRPLRGAIVAGFTGLVAQYAITGLVRAQLGLHQATSSRYVYVASILLLIAFAGWVGTRFAALRVRPLFVLAAIFIVALGANVSALPGGRDAYRMRADATRASIMVTERYGGSPAVPAEALIYPVPTKAELGSIRRELGLPLMDAILPDAPPPAPTIVDAQLYLLINTAFTIATADEMPSVIVEASISASTDVATEVVDGCLEMRVSGVAPWIELRVPGGLTVAVASEAVGQVRASLGLNAPPSEFASKLVPIAPGLVQLIGVPDIGDERPWTVRFDPPVAAGTTTLCIAAGEEG